MPQIDDLDVLSDSAVVRSAEFLRAASSRYPRWRRLVVDEPPTASIAEREIAIGARRLASREIPTARIRAQTLKGNFHD